MIPKGWKSVRFGTVANFRNGVNFSKADSGEEISIVGVADFKRHSQLTELGKLNKVSVSGSVRDDDLLANNDLLFVRSNGNKELIGRCLLFPKVEQRLTFSGFTIRARLDLDSADPLFSSMVVRSEYVRAQFRKLGGGTNISNLSQDILSNTKLLLPPLEEQKAIAAILSKWDEAIEKTEALIAAKEKRKKALMQRILTGKSGSTAKAEALFKNISIKNHPDEPVLSVTQDQGVVLRDKLERKINMSKENTHTYKLVEPNDFIISLRSFQGGLEMSTLRGTVSPAYHVIRAIKPVCNNFYKHYFKSYDFIGRLAVAVIGIRDGKQISYGDFSFMELPYPSLEEQSEAAKLLDLADEELRLAKEELDTVQKQKKALMQILLTGKKRTKAA